ncbi:hypothetical protein ASU31_21880 [Pedobacter ginsenosidimutans]|uniref:Uncharacterized protein n=1 Tax=Pedobacter ginsenosidimutans TaxID=687842 RepID=A0A0T5VJ83_9SPHI|nr:hypothetical protein ASU31_21880 [Pedobacter ginsenosidimutans]
MVFKRTLRLVNELAKACFFKGAEALMILFIPLCDLKNCDIPYSFNPFGGINYPFSVICFF